MLIHLKISFDLPFELLFSQQLGLSPGLGGGQVQSRHKSMLGLVQSSIGPCHLQTNFNKNLEIY